jgi:hypothetical protein
MNVENCADRYENGVCTYCGRIDPNYEPPEEECSHSYERSTTDGTCMTKESTTYTCRFCGDTYTVTGDYDSDNHENLQTLSAVAATCTSTGLTEGEKCEACGVVTIEQTIVPTVDHTYGREEVTVEATCGTDGTKVYYCSECGEPYETVTIPATNNHNPGEWKTTANGHYRCCQNAACDYSVIDECINPTYTEAITTQPTCGTEGEKVFTCNNCGEYSYTQSIPATNAHTYEYTQFNET